MKRKILLFILFFASLHLQAQQNTFSERAYRLSSSSGRVFMASALTPQGNVLFSGAMTKLSDWEQGIFYLVKPNLDTLWSRKGPAINIVQQDVATTPNGGFIFAGAVETPINNSNDMLLNKINANGQQVWARTYDSNIGNSHDAGHSVLCMPDRGFVVGGYGCIPTKESGYSVIRTDSLGNIKWRRRFDWSEDYLATMCFTPNGNILTVGNTLMPSQKLHIKLLLLNPNGDSLKSNVLNLYGLNRTEGIKVGTRNLIGLSDGGFLINANIDTTINGNPNCFLGMLVKVNSNLQVVWKHVYRPFFTPFRDFVSAKELVDGSIVAVGTDMPLTIQPASNNIYLHHISAQGAPINVHTFPSAYSYVFINTMQALPDSSFIVGGNCYTATNDRGFYAAKIKIPGLPKVISGLPAENKLAKVELGQIYPNPATETAIIPYNLPIYSRQAQIQIRDITGREVGSYQVKSGKSNLVVNLSNLSNGLYTYTLLVDGKPVATKKLAVVK